MRQPSDEWNEFDWEQALRESDEFAVRYFDLLRRFCDLPGADELIARHLGPEFESGFAEDDFDYASFPQSLDDAFGLGHEWSVGDAAEFDEFEDEDGARLDASAAEVGDALFYEADPAFVNLRQAAIGWCNIYAAILPPEVRVPGLNVLFYVARSLANLAYSIDDGRYDQPAASIAFAKRSLAQLNHAIGLINQLMAEKPRLRRLLKTLRSHLIRSSDALVDHLQRCRAKSEAGNAQ